MSVIDCREMYLRQQEAMAAPCSHPTCDTVWRFFRNGKRWCMTHVPQYGQS